MNYTPRQLEIANLLNAVGTEGVSSDTVDEVLNMVAEAEQSQPENVAPKTDTEDLIKMRLLDEPDWRKRASLAARLISKGLDY